jgi:hypothetical protein
MKEGWRLYSFTRNGEKYHVGIAYYTGRLLSQGGLETVEDLRFDISEDDLIKLLIDHAKREKDIAEVELADKLDEGHE